MPSPAFLSGSSPLSLVPPTEATPNSAPRPPQSAQTFGDVLSRVHQSTRTAPVQPTALTRETHAPSRAKSSKPDGGVRGKKTTAGPRVKAHENRSEESDDHAHAPDETANDAKETRAEQGGRVDRAKAGKAAKSARRKEGTDTAAPADEARETTETDAPENPDATAEAPADEATDENEPVEPKEDANETPDDADQTVQASPDPATVAQAAPVPQDRCNTQSTTEEGKSDEEGDSQTQATRAPSAHADRAATIRRPTVKPADLADADTTAGASHGPSSAIPLPSDAGFVDADEAFEVADVDAAAESAQSAPSSPDGDSFAAKLLEAQSPQSGHPLHRGTAPDAPNAPAPSPEARFKETNHPSIVKSVRGELLPDGGSMKLKLDPPELGDLQVTVEMRDGQMTASFETSNDQATSMLSHSLGQLKSALEAQGVQVERLQVQQTPRDQPASHQQNDGRREQGQGQNENPAQREQQRREMLRKMWRRVAGGQDPLDLVA